MTHSFIPKDLPHQTTDTPRRKVLVTGAAGRIGSYFAEKSNARYDLRLMVHSEGSESKVTAFGEVVRGELTDTEALARFCDGVDTVVHLAANPSPSATWAELLEPNIIGTYNVFAAAKQAGCRRVIFASSIHAVSGYPADVQVKTSEPVNPPDLYGVTKCFGEALGRYMAEQEGLECIALRIGGFQNRERASRNMPPQHRVEFVSEDDLTQLIQRCIDDEHLQFAIFHGLSNMRHKRLDITDARYLVGYAPQDDLG